MSEKKFKNWLDKKAYELGRGRFIPQPRVKYTYSACPICFSNNTYKFVQRAIGGQWICLNCNSNFIISTNK